MSGVTSSIVCWYRIPEVDLPVEMTLSQVGELASSKSAMKTLAPELRALIIIFRSTGPVISTRRSASGLGASGTVQTPVADTYRFGEEVRALPCIKAGLVLRSCSEQGPAATFEGPVQAGDELDRLRSENPLGFGVRAMSYRGHFRHD